ncbi:MAG: HepT-like ribonuclease domain-containing protein [Acidobacteriota bacterium]
MIDACEAVATFIADRDAHDLGIDRMLLFAVVHAIEVIGEAAVNVSDETRCVTEAIPWSAIVSMRNRLVHGYFDIDTAIVWRTATAEVPQLLPQLRDLLET